MNTLGRVLVAVIAIGGVVAALAADNSTLPVSGGKTEVFANKDVGGIKFPKTIPHDSAGAEIVPATAAQIGATSDAAATAGSTGTVAAKLRLLTTQMDNINTNVQAAIPSGTNYAMRVRLTDATNNQLLDPCQTETVTLTPISITTATTTVIVVGAASKKTYICYLMMTSAAADNVAVVEDTTATSCVSPTAGVIGGLTATNGLNFTANGGVSIGNGSSSIAATATNNNDLCLITSAATPLAGVIKWVQR